MSTTAEHYHQVLERLRTACRKYARDENSVKLLAVSKTKPASQVLECYAEGQRAFGENYLQDALEKITALAEYDDIEWHFIGPLQSNKTRQVAEHFHWLETLDREKIARRLSEQRPEDMSPLKVLIQVNISGEVQKNGVLPDDIPTLANLIADLPGLTLKGLMCIPEASDNDDLLARRFDEMRNLFYTLKTSYPESVDTLSMGMSSDLELAVAHGSTEVRIGTDIFGARAVREEEAEEKQQ